MASLKVVVTTDSISTSALADVLHEAWTHMERAEPHSEHSTARAALLGRPWNDIWELRESPSPPMGIAGNEGEFLIILRDVSVYLAEKWTEAVMAAAAEQLVAEAIRWVKSRRGSDSIELRPVDSDSDEDDSL